MYNVFQCLKKRERLKNTKRTGRGAKKRKKTMTMVMTVSQTSKQ